MRTKMREMKLNHQWVLDMEWKMRQRERGFRGTKVSDVIQKRYESSRGKLKGISKSKETYTLYENEEFLQDSGSNTKLAQILLLMLTSWEHSVVYTQMQRENRYVSAYIYIGRKIKT